MFKKDRSDFESKWDDINVFIQYGVLTDEKFNEKAKLSLFKKEKGLFNFRRIQGKVKQHRQIKMIKLFFFIPMIKNIIL